MSCRGPPQKAHGLNCLSSLRFDELPCSVLPSSFPPLYYVFISLSVATCSQLVHRIIEIPEWELVQCMLKNNTIWWWLSVWAKWAVPVRHPWALPEWTLRVMGRWWRSVWALSAASCEWASNGQRTTVFVSDSAQAKLAVSEVMWETGIVCVLFWAREVSSVSHEHWISKQFADGNCLYKWFCAVSAVSGASLAEVCALQSAADRALSSSWHICIQGRTEIQLYPNLMEVHRWGQWEGISRYRVSIWRKKSTKGFSVQMNIIIIS